LLTACFNYSVHKSNFKRVLIKPKTQSHVNLELIIKKITVTHKEKTKRKKYQPKTINTCQTFKTLHEGLIVTSHECN
jgi:hypothetical protein